MSDISFEALPLAAPIQQALTEKGYTTPSPIQAQSIPVLLEGRDLLACAQTGTGKTAAFALPILHGISQIRKKPRRNEVRTLVLAPTRELAVQVADSFREYGRNVRFSIGLIHGGVSAYPQIRGLQRGLDVCVATPGRLLDLYNQGHVDLSQVMCFVLDEADRMLDMGFIHDIRKIAEQLPEERQTLLFSATMAPEITSLAASLLRNPEEIRIAPQHTTAEKIDQRVLFVNRHDKQDLLFDLLRSHHDENQGELSIVFSKTKFGARKLADKLNRAGIRADDIHGDKSQAARQKTLDRFRDGRTDVLVATDVAARGIDVRNITLVVNYDLPMEADAYVHRIGRTARAGESGRAVSFCTKDEIDLLRAVQRLIKQDVPVDESHAYHDHDTADRASRPAPRSNRTGGARKGGKGGGFRKGGYGQRRGNNGGSKSYGRGGPRQPSRAAGRN
ncbi:MAG: ATP-dependent RNA helicase RhlE [Puniceicoccaceae bacterium 5H]|nr:MAG: ATP-dependent RNA helicase RhlE [Puniceicoccaceae bacterium 5H]